VGYTKTLSRTSKMKKQKCSKCKQPMELLTGTKNRSGVYHLAWVCRRCDDAKKEK
tara:strand:- start:428 stop:592 length:165 start_codon:yes stop_codon:yes gene_type:complete